RFICRPTTLPQLAPSCTSGVLLNRSEAEVKDLARTNSPSAQARSFVSVVEAIATQKRQRFAARPNSSILTIVPYQDPHEERRQLELSYREMSDPELQRLAQHADRLTELAWEVLDEEMERRGLEELPDAPPSPREELEIQKLVTLRQFRDLPEALLAKGALESACIECFLADENLVRLDWFISNFIGGIKLKVRPQDEEAARGILDEPILEGLYVEGVGLYEQPRCPQCQSLDVGYQSLNKPIAYGSAWLGLPIPLQHETWKCHACGGEWDDQDPG